MINKIINKNTVFPRIIAGDDCFFFSHEKGAVIRLPACRRLLFPLLHAEKGRLRNAVANRVPASRWQGTDFA